jgi:MFS transporter, UMF1 family
MPLFDPKALNPGVPRKEVFAWAMYDFANSGYTTVVLTAVFNAYFVGVVAQGAAWATLAWTLLLSVSYVIGMLVMPALGAYADVHARKKLLMALATIGCVVSTALLAFVGAGDLWLAAPLIVVSNLCFAAGVSFNSAFCRSCRNPKRWARCRAGAGASVTWAGCCPSACAWRTCWQRRRATNRRRATCR